MADVLTQEQRHRCMTNIRAIDTKPEVLVRKWLFAKGLRYRKNVRSLPGSPDIVFSKYKLAIFINGCFWHGHEGCPYFVIPKTRTEWWVSKITKTQIRDKEKTSLLEKEGWHVIVIWECQIKKTFPLLWMFCLKRYRMLNRTEGKKRVRYDKSYSGNTIICLLSIQI